ncbi:bestrophin-2-like isoform X4 [Cherax quadricarinatus]|uniref:bestrophin-2-like isoform X4 n=1 Tax=Cherax quadricarinatus TaxID=27406 RepID=UPI00387EDF61
MTVEYTKTMVNTCCCIYVKLLFSSISCCKVAGKYVQAAVAGPAGVHSVVLDALLCLPLLSPGTLQKDSRAFEIRSRIVRYISLTCAMVFAQISGTVHSKYPDSQHLVQEYLATELEGQVLTEAAKQGCAGSKWLPLTWCCQLVQCAREEGFLQTDSGKEVLVTELLRLRRQCSRLQQWHEHNVPLLYTQVVTIAAYTYFVISLLSEQYLDESLKYPSYEVDLVVPAFALLELVFYMGWLKVAEILLNPFGTNDHSFDLLRILEDTRYSAFVICHTRYGQYSAEAQWKSREGRLHIIDLGVLPGMLGEVLTPDTVLGAST